MTDLQTIRFSGNGRLFQDISKNVALIGSRDASQAALIYAYNIGRYLAIHGYTVVNGLARGIDAQGCRGALSANGNVLAFMPCGRDVVYPASSRDIYNKILKQGGCIASMFPDGTRPVKYRFVARDRQQAKFSSVVIVVECKSGGGTMHTIECAAHMGKKIAVVSSAASGNIEAVSKYGGIWVRSYAEMSRFLQSSCVVNPAYTPALSPYY